MRIFAHCFFFQRACGSTLKLFGASALLVTLGSQLILNICRMSQCVNCVRYPGWTQLDGEQLHKGLIYFLFS